MLFDKFAWQKIDKQNIINKIILKNKNKKTNKMVYETIIYSTTLECVNDLQIENKNELVDLVNHKYSNTDNFDLLEELLKKYKNGGFNFS